MFSCINLTAISNEDSLHVPRMHIRLSVKPEQSFNFLARITIHLYWSLESNQFRLILQGRTICYSDYGGSMFLEIFVLIYDITGYDITTTVRFKDTALITTCLIVSCLFFLIRATLHAYCSFTYVPPFKKY